MAQRSYLMIVAGGEHAAILESAHEVPLLWLGLLDAEGADADWGDGATLGLGVAERIGITLGREAALGRLAARRGAIVAWVGEAAGTVLDQFLEFVRGQRGESLRLDVSEWVESFESRAQALRVVRERVAVLDEPPRKRRPAAVRRLLEEIGLAGLQGDAPAFGALLGGAACGGREPWRRDPPRERRAADDRVVWSTQADRHFVSANGRVVATTVRSFDHVETPVLWSPLEAESVDAGTMLRASRLPEEIGFLYPDLLSPDGRVLFCNVVWHPGALDKAVRIDPDGVQVVHAGEDAFAPSACSRDGRVAGGAMYPRDGATRRAAVWCEGVGVRELPGVAPDSRVQRVSADGQVLAGEVEQRDARGGSTGMQAWVWHGAGLEGRVVAEAWRTQWVALSRDGRRGAIAVTPDAMGDARLHVWQDGAGLVPIECGAAGPMDLAFSVDLRCALARTDVGLVLWRPGVEDEPAMALRGEWVEPRHVSDAGDWWVATVRDPRNHSVAAVLLGERGRGVRRFDVPGAEDGLGLYLPAVSAGESLDELVLFGQWRDSGEPVTWTVRQGFVGWGDPPPPVARA